MMQGVSRAGKGAYEQRSPLAAGILDGGGVAIGILPRSLAAEQIVVLAEVAAVYLASLHFKHQLIGEVGIELDDLLPRAEQLVEAEVRLNSSGMAVVAEVSWQPFADQRPALLHILLQAAGGLAFQHDWIGQIDELVLVDILQRHKVGQNILVEERLIRSFYRLGVVFGAALLHIVEEFRLRDEDQANIALDRMRLPQLSV